jgi:hypothetical protein
MWVAYGGCDPTPTAIAAHFKYNGQNGLSVSNIEKDGNSTDVPISLQILPFDHLSFTEFVLRHAHNDHGVDKQHHEDQYLTPCMPRLCHCRGCD